MEKQIEISDNEIKNMAGKYDLAAIKEKTAMKQAEKEEKIKNSIKWGDKSCPIEKGDTAAGVVISLEEGTDKKGRTLLFLTLKGKCESLGQSRIGYISIIVNPVLKGYVKNQLIRTGKEVAITYNGEKQGEKYDTPYRDYTVIEL